MARFPGLVHGAGRCLQPARARGCGHRRVDPEGGAARALRRLTPRRGGLHPADDRPGRRDAARLARGAHRLRAERVARARVVPLELAVGARRVVAASPRARPRLGARRCDPDLPRLSAVLQASAHRDRGHQRVLRPHAQARAARAASLRRARRRDALRRRHDRRPDLEGDGRLVLVHRVWPLSGRLPGVRDREAALAEAPDHGHSRPAAGGRPEPARGRRAEPDRRERRARGDGVGLRHVRRLHPRVPRFDRARRPHRRPASQPRDDGIELPAGVRGDAARRGADRQPVGQAPGRPRGVGGRARGARGRGGRARAGDPLLGRLRRRLRRARTQGGGVDGEAAAEGAASTSRFSARASRAPATRRAGWATSTSSSRTPSRT